jgi:hypothetical protein
MVIDGEEVKREAQNGRMGHQLYCVCVKSRGLGRVGRSGISEHQQNKKTRQLRRLRKD